MTGQTGAKQSVVTSEAVKRFATRSTKASARLERRVVPAEYVRPVRIEQFLAERRSET